MNVPWPGGAQADPAGLGFRFEERGAAAGVADPYAGMGIAANGPNLFVTNSRGEPSAAFRRTGTEKFADARASFDPALGVGFAGWGASFVDLANSGTPDLVLAAGAIPVKSLARDAEPVKVLAPASGSDVRDDERGRRRAPERARPRRRGRGQRRPDGDRDQHDRRQARPPPAERPVRTLARRRAVALLAGRGRHRHARGRADALAHGSGGQQLPLVGGPARPLRPRRRDDASLA